MRDKKHLYILILKKQIQTFYQKIITKAIPNINGWNPPVWKTFNLETNHLVRIILKCSKKDKNNN